MQFLKKMLKPPAYLQVSVFGLDISDNSYKYIKLRPEGSGLVLEDFGSNVIPTGLIESGIIKKPDALAALLRENFSKKKHFRYVSLSLPEEQGFVRLIRLPQIPEEELGEAVALQLEEHIPLAAEEAVFDYQALPGQPTDDHIDVLVVAYPKLVVETYRQVVIDAGLVPVTIEIESQAIARAIIPHTEQHKTVLVVDIGLTRTSFLIAKDGFVQFTSTVPIGGNNIHEAITKTLNVDNKQAEHLKIEAGLTTTPENQQVSAVILPIIQTIKIEMQRRIDFWQSNALQPNNREAHHTDKVYLCGGDANLKGLAHHLTLQLNASVELANVWTNAVTDPTYVPEIEFKDSLSYATSVGLALP